MIKLAEIDLSRDITNAVTFIIDRMDDDGKILFDSKSSTPAQLEAIGALCNYQTFSGKQGVDFDLENIHDFFLKNISDPNESGRMYFTTNGTVNLSLHARAVKSYSYYLRAYPQVANPAILNEMLMGLRYMKFNGPIFSGQLEGSKLLASKKPEKNPAPTYDSICAALSISQIALRPFPYIVKSNVTSHIIDAVIHSDHYTAASMRALTVCLENRNFPPAKAIEFHSILLNNLNIEGSAAEKVLLLSNVVDYLDASLGQVPDNLHVKSREQKDESIEVLAEEARKVKAYIQSLEERFSKTTDPVLRFKLVTRACSCLNAAISFELLTTLMPNILVVRKLQTCQEIWDLPITHENKMSLINAIAKCVQ